VVYAAEYDGWRYTVQNGTATITSYVGSNKDIVIPATIKGVKVTKIGNDAFFYSQIESVTIPGSIKSIGECAFQQCENLKSVTIQDGVETIEKKAFVFCKNLETVTIPDSVTTIGEGAFYSCPLLTNITLPKNIKEISNRLFQGAKSLTSMKVPDGVTSIGDYAFGECFSLKTLILPDSIEKIGTEAFAGTKIEELNIPEGIKYIEHRAFTSMVALKEVKIPDNWTSIDFDDFRGCSGIEEIYIPDRIKSIGEDAFLGCSNLKSIIIPPSVKSIDTGAFSWCENLTAVFIPSSVEYIAPFTFTYSPNAFIIVDENNPVYSSENGILYSKDKTKLLEYPTAQRFFVVREGVTDIGSGAFYGTPIYSIKLPTTLKTIGDSAFGMCRDLRIVDMPSVVDIGDDAFYQCLSISDLDLPENLEIIGEDAFFDCISLKYITIPNSVKSIGEYAFGYKNSGMSGIFLKIEPFVIEGIPNSAGQKYADVNKLVFRPMMNVTMKQAREEANDLYELGLFAGTGNNGFALEEVPTRLQGIIMLIRLMGEEEAARTCTYTNPFKDVPAWGDRYVAWAYHKKYTAGTSATTFSSTEPMTAQQYLAFILRAMGYGNDTVYKNTIDDAKRFGIIPQDAYGDANVPFWRADMVHITYLALQANEKTTGAPFYMYLISKNAIDANTAYRLFNRELVDLSELKDFLGIQ